MNRIVLLFGAQLFLTASMLLAEDPRESVRPSLMATFPIHGRGALLLLPVQIEGKELSFMLRCGSSLHVVDTSLIDHLGVLLEKGITTDGEPIEKRAAPVGSIAVGPLSLRTEPGVYCLDFEKLRQRSGDDLRGIVGIGFFRDRIVQLDFDDLMIRVFARGPVQKSWGTPIALEADSMGLPRVTDISVGGTEMSMNLATGSDAMIGVSTPLFRSFVADGDLRITGIAGRFSTSGEMKRSTGLLDTFSVGPFRDHDLPVVEGSRNLIGLEYLSRFIVTIDVSGNTVYLRKGSRYDVKTDHENLSGVHLLKLKGNVVVDPVDEGSPAEKAGLRRGDLLFEINGESVRSLRFPEIRRLLQEKEGKKVELSIARDGAKQTVSFGLRRYLSAPAARTRQDKDELLLATFPVEINGLPLLLPLTMDGRRYLAMLDTGATNHCFDLSLRDQFGKPIFKAGMKDNRTATIVELFPVPYARVGSLSLRPGSPIALVDLATFRQPVDEDLRAVLGMPFFRNRVVQIDFQKKVVRVYRRQTPKDEWGVRYPIQIARDGRIWVNALRVGERKESFLIDTGFSETASLNSHLFRYLVSQGTISDLGKKRTRVLSGSDTTRYGKLRELSWGPFKWSDAEVLSDTKNSLGINFFSNYLVTFDVSGSCIYLREEVEGATPGLSKIDG